jgi:hypothetical protein
VARGDVEKAQLVRAGRVVGDRGFDRIAGVAQVDEIDTFDHPAVFHVETGNDADLEHAAGPMPMKALRYLVRAKVSRAVYTVCAAAASLDAARSITG